MLSNNFSPSSRSSACQSLAHQIKPEKMDEIIDYILQGKYSSACLLLLESTGQDPLHYIPYRTYNRLQKQRQQALSGAGGANSSPHVRKPTMKINTLDHVESVSVSVSGGFGRGYRGYDFSRRKRLDIAINESVNINEFLKPLSFAE